MSTCPLCGAPEGAQGITAEPPMIHRTNFARVHRALHVLWTAAVGKPGYDKAAWKELDLAVYMLATDGPGRPEGGGTPPG